ncbi:MAG: ATP-binding protein [Candidatus Diapherotrites archaeon]|nr:ATP-binding protein [Candidatus Diapherotrites archaeon]
MVELLEILAKMNPWWQGKKIDSGIERPMYLNKINDYLSTREIVAVNGIRRSGKTTLLKQSINALLDKKVSPAHIFFVNFDEPDIRNLENPVKQVLETYEQEVNTEEAYLFFDEIQNVGEWERHIKSVYDQKKHYVVITGSSSKLLENRLATLLSGRYLPVNVTPLDFREYLNFHGIEVPKDKMGLAANKNKIMKKLKECLAEGGFPRVVLQKDPELKKEHLKAYYESIVYKDILLSHPIRQTKTLRELLYYLISNFTSPYTYDNLSKNLKIDFATVKEYLGYILESKMLYETNFFSYSLKTQARNPKKAYCVDNGLRNTVSFKFSADFGRLAENLVFVELMRRGKEVYYWKGKNEVDFIVKEKGGSLKAINVTYTNEVTEREIKGLHEFKQEFKKTKQLILITKDIDKREGGIRFVPLWKWLLVE